MPTSAGMRKLSFRERAEWILAYLSSPTLMKVKDSFEWAVSGAVGNPKDVNLISKAALKSLPKGAYFKRSGLVKYYANKDKGKNFVFEHTIPNSVLKRWIYANRDILSIDLLSKVLMRCPICLVTAAEDKKLKVAGLNESMPDKEHDILHDDPFARYKAVGIEIVDLNEHKKEE
jgi:hypothetical protein